MNLEEHRDAPPPEDASPTTAKTDQGITALPKPEPAEEELSTLPQVEASEAGETATEPEISPEEAEARALTGVEDSEAAGIGAPQPELDEVLQPSVDCQAEPAGLTPSIAAERAPALNAKGLFSERPPQLIEVAPHVLRHWTRRDVLLFEAGAIAALAGGGSLLPPATLKRLGIIHENKDWPKKEWFLNRALRIDDDVAEALYSPNRRVPTYSRSQVTGLKNNYNGATPVPEYIPTWSLTLKGLESGIAVSLDIGALLSRFALHEEITRFVCVEGWSEIAWWAGIRFADLLQAFPPVSQAKWARIESSVNLDANGNSDPYYISLDLETALHPQSLLATHFHGSPLTLEHGAPLRLIVPVKLGLKNVKAITGITYLADQPTDYWQMRGYSRYDGI